MTLIGTRADFSQTDPRWKDVLLGESTWEKIGTYGCAMAAGANIFQAQGEDLDPAGVNQRMKEKKLFVRDRFGQIADFAGYEAFGKVSPHTQFVEAKFWPESIVAPASYFDVRSTLETEVMVEIDLHPEFPGNQMHFCRVIGLNPTKDDVEIVDSLDGKRKWLSSIAAKGKKKPLQIIWSAAKFKKV